MAGYLLRMAVALVIAVGVFFALMFIGFGIGGSECNRGSCNWFGELISDMGWFYPGLSLLAGLLIGIGVARPHHAGAMSSRRAGSP